MPKTRNGDVIRAAGGPLDQPLVDPLDQTPAGGPPDQLPLVKMVGGPPGQTLAGPPAPQRHLVKTGVDPPLRILRRRELKAKVGYSAAHIDRLEKAGDFPRRIVLGPGAVGWLEHEVDDWIRARVAERDAAA